MQRALRYIYTLWCGANKPRHSFRCNNNWFTPAISDKTFSKPRDFIDKKTTRFHRFSRDFFLCQSCVIVWLKLNENLCNLWLKMARRVLPISCRFKTVNREALTVNRLQRTTENGHESRTWCYAPNKSCQNLVKKLIGGKNV